jgi:hypothetical protein
MYLYISIWLGASIVVLALALYRKTLLSNGMALAFSDPEFDLARYEAMFTRRLQLIDRWVRAVALGCPGAVFGHVMLRFSWQLVHGTATWQVIRSVVER